MAILIGSVFSPCPNVSTLWTSSGLVNPNSTHRAKLLEKFNKQKIKSEPTARKLRAAVFLEAKSALVCETVNFHAREANMLRCYARASCLILKNIQNINK